MRSGLICCILLFGSALVACSSGDESAGPSGRFSSNGGSTSDAATDSPGGQAGSAGSSSGGSHSGGSGGSATGGTGGGSPGQENCLNGVDDNADGNVDCDDPQCSDYACAPMVPAGWTGIGWVGKASDTCPDDFNTEQPLYEDSGLSFSALDCQCKCAEPTDVNCEAPIFGCMGGDQFPAGSASFTCRTYDCESAHQTAVDKNIVATGGSCAASAAAQTKPDPTWLPTQHACLRSTGGKCSSSTSQCVPALPSSVQGGYCIAGQGERVCPSEFPNRTVHRDGTFNDDRACETGTCACGAVTGATCAQDGAQIIWYGSEGCQGTETSSDLDSVTSMVCFATPPACGFTLDTTVTATGQCAATGAGTATGSVTADGSVTVCCAQ